MSGIINFGKRHKGKSLAEVVLRDPDWFFWAMENDVFDRNPGLITEAQELYFKARSIKIPRPDPHEWRIRYVFRRDRKFERFEIIRAALTDRCDTPDMVRAEHLDLSVPRQRLQYDKLGCRLLLKDFKHYFLGSRDARLTKRWCDEFFANPDNFLKGVERPLLCSANPIFNSLPNVGIPQLDPIEPVSVTPALTEEDWRAENEQAWVSWKAEYRKKLEEEAKHSPVAFERLSAEIDEEARQQALDTCAEDERKRQALIAEAESSSLNALFDFHS